MASRSWPGPYVFFNLDDSYILEGECLENQINMSEILEEREEKIKQQKLVEKAIKSLSHMIKEKEAFLEKKEGQQIEIDEEIDDIKVLKEVINVKKLERDQRKMEQKALYKTYKAYWRYDCKLSEKVREKNAEREKKRNRKEEGESGGDGSK